MNRIILAVVVIIAVVGIVTINPTKNKTSKANQTSPSTQSVSAVPNAVTIKNFSFGPAKLTVKKGTKVTWTNLDDAHHDITPTSGASDFVASNLLAKDESHEFTFNTIGTYTYNCSPHPYMKGTIEVTE